MTHTNSTTHPADTFHKDAGGNAGWQGNPTDYNYGNPPPMGNYFLGGLVGVPAPASLDLPMRNYRNRALGLPFRMRERLRDPRPLMGYGCFLNSSMVARFIGAAGFDFAMIDWEHTPMSISDVVDQIKWVQFGGEGQTAAIVRVPNFEHHHIAWVLDAGASGVIIPHTETVEQVQKVVDAARFPNGGGKRSFPPVATGFGINDGSPDGQLVFDVWNQAAIIIQIESKLGCDNAMELASTPGVDALMVGMGDLRMDLGLTAGIDGPEAIYNECLRMVIEAGQKHGKPVFAFTAGKDGVAKRLAQGFTGFVLHNDAMGVCGAMRVALNDGAEAAQEWNKAGGNVELYGEAWGEAK